MKLLLTSAGIKNKAIAKALEELVGKPLTECSIIHIPTAANTFGEDKSWIIENLVKLQKCGFKSIDILDVAAVDPEIWQPRLLSADVICVGGGNELYLAEVFAKIGMKDFLSANLGERVYMGISAGSMVAGQYLSHELLKVVYPEEDFGDSVGQPMGFYDFCFIPHLNSEFFTQVRANVLENLQSGFEHAVYATDDETAIRLVDGQLEIIGRGEHWVYKK